MGNFKSCKSCGTLLDGNGKPMVDIETMTDAEDCIVKMCKALGSLPMSSDEFWGETLTEQINRITGYYF